MIKLFEDFNRYNVIKELCDKYNIYNYFINDDYSILLGTPSYIGGTFYCYDNNLPESLIRCGIKPEIMIKYQDEYEIWYSNGELNKNRLDIMVNDFKMGLSTVNKKDTKN